MKPFYFNYILYFRFPLHNSTGEARPHLPPMTARPCKIIIAGIVIGRGGGGGGPPGYAYALALSGALL